MTICVGSISKVDQISYAPSTLKIGVCVENRHDWIMSIAIRYSFKENNGYYVYLNNTFNGLTPEMNGLLNLNHSDTHVHAKSNDSTTYLWHCYLSHIGIKRMKKLHVDGSLDSLGF